MSQTKSVVKTSKMSETTSNMPGTKNKVSGTKTSVSKTSNKEFETLDKRFGTASKVSEETASKLSGAKSNVSGTTMMSKSTTQMRAPPVMGYWPSCLAPDFRDVPCLKAGQPVHRQSHIDRWLFVCSIRLIGHPGANPWRQREFGIETS